MGALSGKVALITGAGRGFGQATAEVFIEAGADVVLNYRESQAGCEELAQRAIDSGQRALVAQADVADSEAVTRMVSAVSEQMGHIDILVNNAGIMHVRPFVESDEASWRDEIEVNVYGPMRLARAVLPGMIARRYGKIINISSQLALIGWDRAGVYAATKGFILTWTKSLAREVGQYNINVNAIGPGSIITDMNRGIYPSPEAEARRAQELPLRRFGSPRDVGECALFLASDASGFLTGQMLGPNGGNVM
jgi:3-oxoacyl-[acyl-carrier protein] reductase